MAKENCGLGLIPNTKNILDQILYTEVIRLKKSRWSGEYTSELIIKLDKLIQIGQIFGVHP